MRKILIFLLLLISTFLYSQAPIEFIPSDFNAVLTLDFEKIRSWNILPILNGIPGYSAFLDTSSTVMDIHQNDIKQLACGFLISNRDTEYLLAMHLSKKPKIDLNRSTKVLFAGKEYYLYSSWRDLDDCFWIDGKWIVFGTEKAIKMFILQKEPVIPPHFIKTDLIAGFRMVRNSWSESFFSDNAVSDSFESLLSLSITLTERENIIVETAFNFPDELFINPAKNAIEEYKNLILDDPEAHCSVKTTILQTTVTAYKKTIMLKTEMNKDIINDIKSFYNKQ